MKTLYPLKKKRIIRNGLSIGLLVTLLLFVNLSVMSQVVPVIIPDGGVEIDGDLESNNPTDGAGDWFEGLPGTGDFIFNNDGTPIDPLMSHIYVDPYDSNTDLIFQASKFNEDPNSWSWTSGKASGKSDINNVMFHMASDASNDMWLFLGSDRMTTNGTSYIDFEFLQNAVVRDPVSGFVSDGPHGGRTLNDLIVSVQYDNGGSAPTIMFYLWSQVGTDYKYVEQVIPAGAALAFTN
ncbi:MAG: hypothetical protein C0596_01425 [Marinilabiliales bacterium]|nr:MAG: hypothetical protein C0596_01425 [Marinilabiliales bacterium]